MSRPLPDPARSQAPGPRAATIDDVAASAGVCKASVSRFLSGKSGILSEATRRQIQQAVAALDYRPNQMARSLKGGRTRLIGMIVADVTNPYSVAVLRGAEDECQRCGYVLALCNSGGSPAKEQALLAGLQAYRIEGLILNSACPGAGEVSDALPPGLPVVLLDRIVPPGRFDFVGLDNVAAAAAATRHLLARGFGTVALVAEPLSGVSVRRERAEGFRQALADGNGAGEVIEVDLADPGGMQGAVAGFLAAPSAGRKAVIAASGLVTLRVIQAVQALGRQLPGDVGLVGFDELEWSALVPPGITTIGQPTHDIGVAAVRSLLARLAEPRAAPGSVIFPGTLIARGSSAAPDPERHQV